MQTGSTGTSPLLYLYGVTGARSEPPPAPARLIAGGGLCALVAEVSRDEFAPDALEEKLQSLHWVADRARVHQAMLDHASRRGAVIPARLCTLFSGPQAVRAYLDREGERLHAVLARVAGCQEWGLKVFCDEGLLRARAAADDSAACQTERPHTSASPGRAHVLTKRREARCRARAAAERDAVADQILDAVEPLLADAAVRPTLSEHASGRRETMILNLAALVPCRRFDAFRTILDDFAGQLSVQYGVACFHVELSGPWPPYSFSAGPASGEIRDQASPLHAEEAR